MGTILVVDDIEANRKLLNHILKEGGHEIEEAKNGTEAWELLQTKPDKFDAILLDRMMPDMDGIEVLKRMKQNEKLKYIPVIFQSAMVEPKDVSDGLKEGAFYYITKPYPDDEVIHAIVRTAVVKSARYKSLQNALEKTNKTLTMAKSIEFEFQSSTEGDDIAAILASICPNPDNAVVGITELFLNAIQHGNLGIGYDQKSKLKEEDRFFEEVSRLMELPENKAKKVRVTFMKKKNVTEIVVEDDGEGFNWKPFMTFDNSRIFDAHGRGIAMAKIMTFNSLEYQGKGNKVLAKIIG